MTRQLPSDVWERVMVIAPHPDDETLAAGGLLQHARQYGAAIRVVFITDGENNPWPQRALEHRWRLAPADRVRWGMRRRNEALQALVTLGLPAACATFLGYPDQGITSLLLSRTEGLSAQLASLIADWYPSLLVVPSVRDAHPDHSATALLTQRAVERVETRCPSLTQLSYVIHGQFRSPTDIQLSLSAEQQASKRRAIRNHASQMVLSRRRFLAFAQERESFFPLTPLAGRDDHPTSTVDIQGNFFNIEIRAKSLLHAFLSATLYIVSNNTTAQGIRYTVELPRTTTTVSVLDATSREVVTSAEFCGDWRRGELHVPLNVLPLQRSVFVKLAHRHSFFDVEGWQELAVPPAPSLYPIVDERQALRRRSKPVTCCVVPCYNVADLCEEVVRAAATYVDYVIVVDDGSTDETGRILDRIAQDSQGHVRALRFAHNRGKGVALLAAFRYALAMLPFDVLVTCDGDRQHRAADIPHLVQKWQEEQAALVIGSRHAFAVMPLRNRLGNTITSMILHALYRGSPHDTQSGFRAHDRSFVEEIVHRVKGTRYETELAILMFALERRRRVSTVPIPTIYLPGNRSSHYRPALDSLRIFGTLLTQQLVRGLTASLNVIRPSLTKERQLVRNAHNDSQVDDITPTEISAPLPCETLVLHR